MELALLASLWQRYKQQAVFVFSLYSVLSPFDAEDCVIMKRHCCEMELFRVLGITESKESNWN